MLQSKNSVVLVKNLITKAGQIVPNFTDHGVNVNSRGKCQALTAGLRCLKDTEYHVSYFLHFVYLSLHIFIHHRPIVRLACELGQATPFVLSMLKSNSCTMLALMFVYPIFDYVVELE